MRTVISVTAVACCGLAWGAGCLPHSAIVSAQTSSTTPYDWTTDGGDNQRTGWNKQEKILTKDSVKNLKLLWKLETRNQVRALHSLMPVLVVGQLPTPAGSSRSAFSPGFPTISMRSTPRPERRSGKNTGTTPRLPAVAGVAAGLSPRIPLTSASCGPGAAATRRSSVPPMRKDAARSIS